MDANNDQEFASEEALKYWENVDLYIGGSEHATGHLLYSRFWVKFMKDRGFVHVGEPFKKLINQGMILGTSAFVYRLSYMFAHPKEDEKTLGPVIKKLKNIYISHSEFISKGDLASNKEYLIELKGKLAKIAGLPNADKLENVIVVPLPIHVKVEYVNASDELDIDGLKTDGEFGEDYKDAIFIGENGKIIEGENDVYKVGREVEKMSKSKYNVVNPDSICEQYGADSLRLYEMFLGPLEQYKPWNTAGISGVHGFLKKLWKLYVGENGLNVNNSEPTKDNLKTLHKTIKKVEEDIEAFSFNTSVSTFMIAVNELTAQKCTSKQVLEPLLILLSPYAPHIAEELWSKLGHNESISTATFPKFEEKYLVESSKNYPISFNGKMRFTLELPLDMSKEDIEKTIMAHDKTKDQLQGREPKKVIVVPGKIVNIVG